MDGLSWLRDDVREKELRKVGKALALTPDDPLVELEEVYPEDVPFQAHVRWWLVLTRSRLALMRTREAFWGGGGHNWVWTIDWQLPLEQLRELRVEVDSEKMQKYLRAEEEHDELFEAARERAGDEYPWAWVMSHDAPELEGAFLVIDGKRFGIRTLEGLKDRFAQLQRLRADRVRSLGGAPPAILPFPPVPEPLGRSARNAQASAGAATTTTTVVREIVKTPCTYCGVLVEITRPTCPSCGAPFKHP